jgi:hypothetical protein
MAVIRFAALLLWFLIVAIMGGNQEHGSRRITERPMADWPAGVFLLPLVAGLTAGIILLYRL